MPPTPGGKPEIVALFAVPATVYRIFAIGVFMQTVWASLDVLRAIVCAVTVIVPLNVTGVQVPDVVIVYG